MSDAVLVGTGRYAPSPTGELHLGSVRTALCAWLAARAAGAAFVLRVDDLDPERSRDAFIQGQLEDLAALGLDWDGPLLRQRDRSDAYRDVLTSQLLAERTYPCFCSRADIRAAAGAPHSDTEAGRGADAYPGTCSRLSEREAARRVSRGEAHCVRVRADDDVVSFRDVILGEHSTTVDDFVVQRKDGVAAYNLACITDDTYQQIGHVLRGADLAATTPRQIWLARQLGWPVPQYAHVPLVLGPDGVRLAKRFGDGTLRDLRSGPKRAGAVRALLARSLGIDSATPEMSASDLVPRFTIAAVPRTAVTIDEVLQTR